MRVSSGCLPAAVALAAWMACAGARADEIADARELIRKGQAQQAYALLEPLEATRAGEIDFDYMLGVAAFDSRRFDRAIVSFERALITSPGFFSARFDLARAYFALNADAFAEQEFRRLLAANPTPEGVRAINDYLLAIDRRRNGAERRFKLYVETGAGHDSNLSSTTPDFTNAIGGAFGIPGVLPTGNSVLQSSPYGSLNGGVNGALPIAEGFDATASLDLKARDYSRNKEFNYQLADAQLGVLWSREGTSAQLSLVGQAFRQDGAAPPPDVGPTPTSDRNATGANLEARHAIVNGWETFGVLQYMRLRYPTNATQDTDQGYVGAGVLRSMPGGAWPGFFIASAYYSRDEARATYTTEAGSPPLDVSRHTTGLRGYLQRDFGRGANAYLLLAWSRRTDDGAYARATTIEYGRDDLTEVTLGAAWPVGRWSLRPTVTFLRNSSNIELYSFKRIDGGLVVRYEFP